MEISQKKAESPTNEEKDSKDQNRKRLKGEQAQTLAQLQELHPSKKERLKTSNTLFASELTSLCTLLALLKPS
jgi:hypothetical protein